MVGHVNNDNIYRYALYIGSFPVAEYDCQNWVKKVHAGLDDLRVFDRSKRVCICISVRGVKIYSEDRSNVYMAHALRRISYATCVTANKQFAFLAREPKGAPDRQYCHVFTLETSHQAEELNHIVGDAFQLAFMRQKMLATNVHPAHSTNGTVTSHTMPRLSDRHSSWLVSGLGMLELPPPPACPPPPAPVETFPSSAVVDYVDDNVDHQTNGICEVGLKQSGGQDQSVSMSNQIWRNGARDDAVTERLDEDDVTTPQVNPFALRRRRQQPDPIVTNTTTVVDTVTNRPLSYAPGPTTFLGGGSTREPRRRVTGTRWSNLFSSARHSAFYTSSSTACGAGADPHGIGSGSNSPPNNRLDCVTISATATGEPQRHRGPLIVMDLRNFSGGSPVVALKERLDAQALAEAKASAFAEAAAILAAAKQAAVSSASGMNGQYKNNKTSSSSFGSDVCSVPVVSSTSPCSTTSTSSEPCRHIMPMDFVGEGPPTPPVRIHSLRRSQEYSGCNKPLPSSAQYRHEHRIGRDQETDSALESHNRLANWDNSKHEVSCALGLPRKESIPHIAFNSQRATICDSSSHDMDGIIKRDRSDESKGWISTTQSRRPAPQQQHVPPSHVHDQQASIPPLSSLLPTSTTCLLSNMDCTTNRSVGPNSILMSTSTLSTDTPTPTATPTPTQTPQPMGLIDSRSDDGGFGEDWFPHAPPWFEAELPREIAFERLSHEPVGSFLVRNSVSHPDCCALSVRVPLLDNPTGIIHYLIQRTSNGGGVRLKGLDKQWPSLRALITHLTVLPEMLPCTLRLPCTSTNPTFQRVDPEPNSKKNICIGPCGDSTDDSNASFSSSSYLPPSQTQHSIDPTTTCQPVTSLPSRPVPPTCASRSHQQSHSNSARLHRQFTDAPTGEDMKIMIAPDVPQYNSSVPCDEEEDDEEDEDYQRLSDFSSILADFQPRTETVG